MDPSTPKQPILRSDSPPPIKRTDTLQRQYTFQAAKYIPDDFIKPDPSLTRSETRSYILNELKSCLNNLSVVEDEHYEDDSYLTYCSNPRERLYHIQQILDELCIDDPATDISLKILTMYLNRETINYDTYPVKLVHLVIGFIHTDLLPCNRTIYSFWNHSPLAPLRNAPPLSDEEVEEESEEEEGEEEEEAEEEEGAEETEEKTEELEYAITVRFTYQGLFSLLTFITIWIALTVGQLGYKSRYC
jgi:hypothetical protein